MKITFFIFSVVFLLSCIPKKSISITFDTDIDEVETLYLQLCNEFRALGFKSDIKEFNFYKTKQCWKDEYYFILFKNIDNEVDIHIELRFREDLKESRLALIESGKSEFSEEAKPLLKKLEGLISENIAKYSIE